MKPGLLTREQAIKETSAELVDRLDNEHCEPTSRLMPDGCELVEFAASVHIPETDEQYAGTLTAYYYQTQDESNVEDLSDLDWEIAGYEVV